MSRDDLYKTLGVTREASLDEIKKAYRRLALVHHPDVNGGDSAAVDRFRRVSHAYKVLSDRTSRADYDTANAFAGMSRRTRMTGSHNFGHRMREAGHRGEPGTPQFDADAWNATQFTWSDSERMEALRRRMDRATAAAADGAPSRSHFTSWDWHQATGGRSGDGAGHAGRDRTYRAWATGLYRTAASRDRTARMWGWVGVWVFAAAAVMTLRHGRSEVGSGDPAWAAEAARISSAGNQAPVAAAARVGWHGAGEPAAAFLEKAASGAKGLPRDSR